MQQMAFVFCKSIDGHDLLASIKNGNEISTRKHTRIQWVIETTGASI